MGRKSRAKHLVKSPSVSAYTNKKEVAKLVQKLFQACIKPTTKKDEWNEYMEIQFIVERIRQYQTNRNSVSSNRMEKVSQFEDWLKKNDVTVNNIKIEDYGEEYGFGVKATSSVKREDELTCIPYGVMITAEKATKSYLGDMIKTRKMLSDMPNVCLALYLHCEKHNPNSFHKPYLDVLPTKYNTTVNFSMEEMEYLKGSSALSIALSQYKSIARQYAIFFQLMHGDTILPEVQKISEAARNEFTFDAYRWAVSTVSTRQNRITLMTNEESESALLNTKPDQMEPKQTTLALIPMWDMFNHGHGQLSTDCDPENKYCKSYAMRDFSEGEQVTIFYGARSNADFVVYNGFVCENNLYDRVEIPIGVSGSDKLYTKKCQLLKKLCLKPVGAFQISAVFDYLPTCPDFLAFLRVFHMNEEELDEWIEKDKCLKDIFMPYELGLRSETEMWKFLENRVSLLLRSYKRTPEEEEALLSNSEVSENIKLSIRLHKETRKVLKRCQDFCQQSPQKFMLHKRSDEDHFSGCVNELEEQYMVKMFSDLHECRVGNCSHESSQNVHESLSLAKEKEENPKQVDAIKEEL